MTLRLAALIADWVDRQTLGDATCKSMRMNVSDVVKLLPQKWAVRRSREGGLQLNAWQNCSAMLMVKLASTSFARS
ncbi:hypothetical protein BGP83_20085 [Pseudomonas putida]|nr:hypothetical protein BGP83_20085 [Pseudomonas putida]